MTVGQEDGVESVTVTINGRSVEGARGQTILELARSVGIEIPTLCNDPRLEPYGACRLCLVEVDGAAGPVPACVTKIVGGMVVQTHTEKVQRLRRFVIQLLLSNHPLDCPVCEAAGDCRLQDYAFEFQVDTLPWGWHPQTFPTRDDHPNIARNPNRCILCGRCVRVCRDLMGIGCWGYSSRGSLSIIDTPLNMPLERVGCVSCGQCVSTCPVGALSMKRSRFSARHWQTDKTVSTCPYCGVGCEQLLHTFRGKLVRVTAPLGDGVNGGNLCSRGRFGMDYVGSGDRLTQPLVRNESGELAPASWDEALAKVGEGLRKAKAAGGAASVGFFASATCTNEDNYALQKLARGVIGTNNLDCGARLGEAASAAALRRTLGYGAMTNSIADLSQADVILVAGSNTTAGHPVLAMQLVKAAREGKKLIVIDPRITDIAARAQIHLRLKPGTDLALLQGMIRHILDSGLGDAGFVAERTDGYEEFVRSLDAVSVEAAADACGVEVTLLREASQLFGSAGAAAIVCSLGVTQQVDGVANVEALAALALLSGNIGRPGTGVNALASSANTVGACDMGCLPDFLPGYRSLGREAAGKTAGQMIEAGVAGALKALYIMGDNPVVSQPDQARVREALEKTDFVVVQDAFLTETAALADVVLPACVTAEKDGTVTNTERRVQRVRRALEPQGESAPDWEIVQSVATRLGVAWSWTSPEAVFNEAASVNPLYAGITWQRLEQGGIQWPCPDGESSGTSILYSEGFPDGKAHFLPLRGPVEREQTEADYPLVLITGRQLSHFGTGVMSRRAAGLAELVPEARVEVNPEDADRLGLVTGDPVRVTSRLGSVEPAVWVTPRVPPGAVFLPVHFQEAAANTLVAAPAGETEVGYLKTTTVRLEAIR
jgi:formate dehydrogenase (NADP+) alpha subunit